MATVDQRQLVEASVLDNHWPGVIRRGERHTYTCPGMRPRGIGADQVISTIPGAYWRVVRSRPVGDETELLLEALKPTDPRTHNGATTLLYGGVLR